MGPCPSLALNLSMAPYFLLENVQPFVLAFKVLEAPGPARLILGGAHLAAGLMVLSGLTISACRPPKCSLCSLESCSLCMPT